MKKKIVFTEYQNWLIQKKLLQAKAKRLKTTPQKIKIEEATKNKILNEISQAIREFKPSKKLK